MKATIRRLAIASRALSRSLGRHLSIDHPLLKTSTPPATSAPGSDVAGGRPVFSRVSLTSMPLGFLLLALGAVGAWIFLVTAIAVGYYLGKYLAGEVRREEYAVEEGR